MHDLLKSLPPKEAEDLQTLIASIDWAKVIAVGKFLLPIVLQILQQRQPMGDDFTPDRPPGQK